MFDLPGKAGSFGDTIIGWCMINPLVEAPLMTSDTGWTDIKCWSHRSLPKVQKGSNKQVQGCWTFLSTLMATVETLQQNSRMYNWIAKSKFRSGFQSLVREYLWSGNELEVNLWLRSQVTASYLVYVICRFSSRWQQNSIKGKQTDWLWWCK